MVQVVTVSANTAAWAADAMKTPIRVSRAKFVEQNQRAVEPEAEKEALNTAPVAATVSEATSSALNFLTAGHDEKSKSNNTLQQTLDAYESF